MRGKVARNLRRLADTVNTRFDMYRPYKKAWNKQSAKDKAEIRHKIKNWQ